MLLADWNGDIPMLSADTENDHSSLPELLTDSDVDIGDLDDVEEVPDIEQALPKPKFVPFIETRYFSEERGCVSIRTNMGADAARRMACLELGKAEVFIHLVFDSPVNRIELMKEMMQAKKEQRPYVPPVQAYDYLFRRGQGQRCMPDRDFAAEAAAFKKSDLPATPPKPKRKLMGLYEYLRSEEGQAWLHSKEEETED